MVPAHRSSARALRSDLLHPRSVIETRLIKTLSERVQRETGRRPVQSEKTAWRESLSDLACVLDDAGLGEVEVLVEFPMPHNRRSSADVVLAGVHPETGRDTYVVVELKQWSEARAVDEDKQLFEVPNLGQKSHPSLQAKGYRSQIVGGLAVLDGRADAVTALVYLHNADPQDVSDLSMGAACEGVPVFTRASRGSLIEHLLGLLANSPGRLAADRLLGSRIHPSQNFLRKSAEVIRGFGQFDLLDQQLDAFAIVRARVREANEANTKRVVIITGGPGSGKSAIALSLLQSYIEEGNPRIAYATGSSTVTKTLRKHVAGRDRALHGLFRYYMEFANASRNELDLLIADEAHRVRKNSFDLYRKQWRSDRPQIESMINASRVPVFLLDEHQVVKPDEVGTVAAIVAQAQAMDLAYDHVRLDAQWRCGGSAIYDTWVLRLLGLGASDGEWNGGAEPERWPGDPAFQVHLAGSPAELEGFLHEKLSQGQSARIMAGYCWPWSKPVAGQPLVPDVTIGEWARPWNLKQDKPMNGIPPSTLWATTEGGFGQVGCVYTAQGLEFDWAGVIIGPDLVARNGRFVPRQEYSKDRELTRSAVTHEQFGRLVRNIYKVLLTRGLRGVVVHAVDEETQDFLADLIQAPQEGARR
ncbi:DNA/RNA helicase domain-containing protein [Nonomuraea sp. NPDC050663]|uniref:DNA/RNA helicase domain-containing protein n=1 Tax=Nonomuraea sp. NPDC050663 TaxID=3364370 RepID=UPI0037BA0C33